MGLSGAVIEVIDILQGRPSSGGEGPDHWERFIRIIAQNDSLPHSEVEVIESAIAKAYDGWTDAQRQAIWYETESGMADCDDEDELLCDTSLNGIGHALQSELLEEITRTVWQHAGELKGAIAKQARMKKGANKSAFVKSER